MNKQKALLMERDVPQAFLGLRPNLTSFLKKEKKQKNLML